MDISRIVKTGWFCGLGLMYGTLTMGQATAPETVATSTPYWVYFTDKGGQTFDPYAFFDPLAIQRRKTAGIPVFDSTDIPVDPRYIREVGSICDSIDYPSRWFNALAIYAKHDQLNTIRSLPFVSKVEAMTPMLLEPAWQTTGKLNCRQTDLLVQQTAFMEGALFKEAGLTGRGIRIAILDAGFPGVDTDPVFQHIRSQHHIISTYDFVKKQEWVYGYSTHGAMVLSCIAGIYDSIPVGLAPDAEFLLARTENVIHEPFSEEKNWLAAVEWADKQGVQIINSSLGYTVQRYFPEDMNGKTSLIARAATMAASKGILVVNAAGNEGDNRWKHIASPGDADSILTVGAINPNTGYKSDFSSIGPTVDHRLKPNVSAFGTVMASTGHGTGNLEETSGTSFASPLVAGFAACAWQKDTTLTNMQMLELLQQSGHLYPYFDYAHGYGVPQASFFTKEMKIPKPTFEFAVDSTGYIEVDIRDTSGLDTMNMFATPPLFTQREDDEHEPISAMNASRAKPYLIYYHIANASGMLRRYAVIQVQSHTPLTLSMYQFKPGDQLSVCFRGYVHTYVFK